MARGKISAFNNASFGFIDREGASPIKFLAEDFSGTWNQKDESGNYILLGKEVEFFPDNSSGQTLAKNVRLVE